MLASLYVTDLSGALRDGGRARYYFCWQSRGSLSLEASALVKPGFLALSQRGISEWLSVKQSWNLAQIEG